MKITKFNRYPLSNMFMFIGLVIAFLAVIYGSSLYTKVENGNKESKNYKYNDEMLVSFYSVDGNYLHLERIAKSDNINVEIALFAMGVGEHTRVVNIAYSYNEEPSYVLKEGRLPSADDIKNRRNVVNIGKNLLDDVYMREDVEYIKFDGVEYEVIGYFGSETSDALDSIIYFVYDCLDAYHKSILAEQDYLYIRYGSNINDVYANFISITDNIDNSIEYSVEDAESFDTGVTNAHDRDMFYFFIYAFSIGVCMIISELWIYERMDEIAILKTVGYTMGNIVVKLYRSIIGIMTMSLLMAYIILFMVENTTSSEMIDLSSFLMVAMLMILSSVVVLIVPVIKVKTIAPAQCINSRGNY